MRKWQPIACLICWKFPSTCSVLGLEEGLMEEADSSISAETGTSDGCSSLSPLTQHLKLNKQQTPTKTASQTAKNVSKLIVVSAAVQQHRVPSLLKPEPLFHLLLLLPLPNISSKTIETAHFQSGASSYNKVVKFPISNTTCICWHSTSFYKHRHRQKHKQPKTCQK